jgi:hypothetical protein
MRENDSRDGLMNRRAILKGLGAGAVGLAGLSGVSSATATQESDAPSATIKEYDDSHMVIDIHDIEIPSIDIVVVFADGSEEHYVNEVVDHRAVLTELPGGIELSHVTISHDDTELLSTYLPNGVGSDGEYVPVSDSIAYTYKYGTWWPDTYDDNDQTGYDPDPDNFYVRGNRKRALVIAPVPFKVVYATYGHGKGNDGKHDHDHDHDHESWGCGHEKKDEEKHGKKGEKNHEKEHDDKKHDGKHGDKKHDGKHGKKRCKERKPVYAKPVRFEDVDVAASEVDFDVDGRSVWVAMVPYGYHRKMKRRMGNVEWPDGGKRHRTCGKCGEEYEKDHEGCPKCGKENDGDHDKCGKKDDEKHRTCGKCGKEYDEHRGKCPKCGKKYGGKLCWFRVHPKLPTNS